jgi:UDPglucose 6-dehydrogenase
VATERAKEVLPMSANLIYADDLYKAATDADAVVILTEWKEFASVDLDRLREALRFPIMVDGRNLFKPQQMQDHGFTCFSVGRLAAYLESKASKLVI